MINVTHRKDNAIIIYKRYNETTKDVYIKARKNRTEDLRNHSTDEPGIYVAKLKQEIRGKDREKRKKGGNYEES